jgi:dTDP-4-dehydrorhamnose 3,5-epimerase
MIKDVKIKYIKSHYDDRGFFAEVIKEGEETFHPIKQTSYTETNPGIIKAFHWHNKQNETWFVVKGSAKVVLVDRETKETMVLYPNESNKMLIYIPIGVAHGYQVLGNKTFGMFYHTSESYNPKDPDEQRIPFDELYDWTIHNR